MNKPIRFERQYMPREKCTVVALDAKLEDFKGKPIEIDGKMMLRYADKTVKDCRGIDGCIYMCLGRVHESVMNQYIELYQKACKSEKWKEGGEFVLPDDKLNLGI